ncbi:MAG TPA: hypothetical protein VH117_07835 [Edaphobacter sp.]|nr:hypothetical protein [Edaphobacter sp.]
MLRITTATLVLAAAPLFAQTSGVSHPDPAVITSDDAPPAAPVLKARPSAAIPAASTPSTTTAPAAATPGAEVYGPYVPYKGPGVAGAPAVNHVTPVENPEDAMIVVDVPERAGELREGTLLKTKMISTLSTESTVQGSRFTAEVTEPIERNGRVIIPVGSILEGRVTEVHGGKRISGGALLHLETNNVTLPDGTHYIVHAQVIDTGKSDFKVTDEGTLKKKEHAKETLAVMGGVTGAGAATGAVVGGGVGAIVGASIGAGVSTVIWLKQDRQATLPKDVQLVFSLTTPMILTPLSGTAVSSVGTAGVHAAQ